MTKFLPTIRLCCWIIMVVFALCSLDSRGQNFGGGAGGGRPAGINRGGAARAGGGGGSGFGGSGSRTYPSNGTVGEAMITSDPETRRIIVITDEETSQYVSQVVTNLDRPKPQVLINVVFLEVTYNNSMSLGIEGGNVARLVGTNNPGNTNIFNGLTQSGLYTLGQKDWQVTLRAIAQAGKFEVLSRPTILARNNQQASITVGEEVPLVSNVRYDQIGNQINTVQYQDVGIILRVTPFITSDGLVEMIVAPEISQLTERSIPISRDVGAPVIAKRSADTVVVTPDGQTVIIGGLMENKRTVDDSKVPFLGDIPGLGNLFKRKSRDGTKTELMIFLTPHIIMTGSQLAQATGTETGKSDLGTEAFTEEELNKFLGEVTAKQFPPKKPDPKKRKKK